jgi:sporulation protein YlmC with PRC-barrel domain
MTWLQPSAPPTPLVSLEQGAIDLATDADDVRGLVVLDSSGHRVGEVDDILVDEEHRRARMLVVASGGVLGLGAHRRLVPVEAVARVSDHVRLHHVEASVLHGEDQDGASLEPRDSAAVYRSYGCTPYWDPAHTTASFHERQW